MAAVGSWKPCWLGRLVIETKEREGMKISHRLPLLKIQNVQNQVVCPIVKILQYKMK